MASEGIYEKPCERTMNVLRPTQTGESVLLPIPRDVFEKLYLSPKLPNAGNLHKTFGNPTPIALSGFLLAGLPTACILMGWRGAGGNGGAILPVYIFFGGVLQLLGAIGEWVLGNTFSCALFSTYGTFWLVFGTSLMPSFAVGTNYSPTGNSLEGETTTAFYATVGFYYACLCVLTFIYLICSIRTNVCLMTALFLLVIDTGMFVGIYFNLALGNAGLASRLQVGAGAITLVLCIPIGALFVAQIFEAVDFPVAVPVGDLSMVILGKRQRARKKEPTEVELEP